MEEIDNNQIHFLEALSHLIDPMKKTNYSTISKFMKFVKKFDFDIDIVKLAIQYSEQRRPVTFLANNKKYRITDKDIQFILGTNHKTKDGGFLPLIPALLGLLGTTAIAASAAKKIHNNSRQLSELKTKSGGILPLLALLPLIFGGVAAAGGIAGGAAGIAKTIIDKKASDAAAKRDQIFKDKLLDKLNKKEGTGIISEKIGELEDGIIPAAKQKLSNTLLKLSKNFDIVEKKDGSGLYLEMRPRYGSGIYLQNAFNGNGIYLPRSDGSYPRSKGKGLIIPKEDEM